MIVRRVTAQDFENLLTLVKYQVSELEADHRYDHNTTLENLRVSATKNQYFCFIALEGTRPVGFITGHGSNFREWSNEISANISNYYLLASHRSNDRFQQLFNAVTEWAGLIGAGYITAELSGIDTMDQMINAKLPQRMNVAVGEI